MKHANFAIVAIAIVVLVQIISGISSFLQYELLLDLKEGVDVPWEELNDNDNRERLVGISALMVYSISVIFFLIWFYNAYKTLGVRLGKLKYAVNQSVFGWIIPIVSLYRPIQIMRELDSGTVSILEQREKKYPKKFDSIIEVWWTFFILINWVSNIFMKIGQDSETIDGYIFTSVVDAFTAFLYIPLGIFTVQMIKNYSEKEELLYLDECSGRSTQIKTASVT